MNVWFEGVPQEGENDAIPWPRSATVKAEDLETKYLERGILLDVLFSLQGLSGSWAQGGSQKNPFHHPEEHLI